MSQGPQTGGGGGAEASTLGGATLILNFGPFEEGTWIESVEMIGRGTAAGLAFLSLCFASDRVETDAEFAAAENLITNSTASPPEATIPWNTGNAGNKTIPVNRAVGRPRPFFCVRHRIGAALNFDGSIWLKFGSRPVVIA